MKMGGERVTSSSSGGSGSGSGRKCGRWNPTEEQLKVLSHLFACGLRTPTTPQIQHISNLLSLYGPIESKNVFYWFQNHKARHRLKRPKLPPPLPPPAPEDDDNQVAPLPAERAMETLQLFPLHSLGRSSHVHSHCPQHHTAEPLEPPPLDLRLSFL